MTTASADGGAIYLDNVHSLNNVYIINALASRDTGNIQGGAICFQNAQGINSMNNVTVIGSRASTGNGNSYGGAVYLYAKSDDFNVYNSFGHIGHTTFMGYNDNSLTILLFKFL